MLIQRNQRSAREKPAVGSGDEVILVVLPHPQHAEIDEADHVHEHLRRKLAQRPRKPLRRYGLGRWNGDAEDQDGHRNGEDAVEQEFQPALADDWNRRVLVFHRGRDSIKPLREPYTPRQNVGPCSQHDPPGSCRSRRSRVIACQRPGPPVIALPSCSFTAGSRRPIAE